MAATTVTPNKGVRTLHWGHVWTVARTDLKQLAQARDYWIPMLILGGIFFVFVPTVLLFTITQLGNVDAVSQLSQALEVLPERAQAAIQGDTEQARAGYALAVYLFAPVAVVVPITISTAVGAATIVGERERGTGEFLAHSPAGIREIFLGKLAASLVPGYATTIVGFGIYALIVNTIVGPDVGGWFFPTSQWWVLMLWVVPPFLALTLSLVLRLSAKVKSTAAAQQASALVSLPLIMVAYSQATGSLYGGNALAWYIGGDRLGARRHRPLARHPSRHPRAPPRRRRRAVAPLPGELDGLDQLVRGTEREPGDRLVRVPHDALRIDHERGAPVEAERPEDPVGLAHGLVGVGEEREGEPALLAGEVVVALHRLRAHRQHLGPGVGEGVDVLGVGVELAGAHGRAVARVEHQHDHLPAVLLERVVAPTLVRVVTARQGEGGRWLADLRAHQASIPSRMASGMSKLA